MCSLLHCHACVGAWGGSRTGLVAVLCRWSALGWKPGCRNHPAVRLSIVRSDVHAGATYTAPVLLERGPSHLASIYGPHMSPSSRRGKKKEMSPSRYRNRGDEVRTRSTVAATWGPFLGREETVFRFGEQRLVCLRFVSALIMHAWV
jgi:hypothetical protein